MNNLSALRRHIELSKFRGLKQMIVLEHFQYETFAHQTELRRGFLKKEEFSQPPPLDSFLDVKKQHLSALQHKTKLILSTVDNSCIATNCLGTMGYENLRHLSECFEAIRTFECNQFGESLGQISIAMKI